MNLFNSNEEQQPEVNTPELKKEKPSTFKIFIGTLGALFAVSHIGLVGYLMRQPLSLIHISEPTRRYAI